MSAHHPATDAWLRQERARLRPALMVHAFHRPAQFDAAARLRGIADELRTRCECGDFDLCFEHTRQDMASLPAALRAIADEIGRAA